MNDCWHDISRVIQHEDFHLKHFMNDFRTFYQEKTQNPDATFTNKFEVNHGNIEEVIDKCALNEPKYKVLQARAYLGLEEPNKKSWFLKDDQEEDSKYQKISGYLR